MFLQNNSMKKLNSCVFYITIFVTQELNNETQILLKRVQRQSVFLTTSVYRKIRSKDNKILQNVRIEKSVPTVFTKTDRFMLKNFIKKFSPIIEKHAKKLSEIESIEISDHDSIVIVHVSIEFGFIITILKKNSFFSQKL